MNAQTEESAIRKVRFINLSVLLFFLPFAILGSNSHAVFHSHQCSDEAWMADLVACLDAPGRVLDDVILAWERRLAAEPLETAAVDTDWAAVIDPSSEFCSRSDETISHWPIVDDGERSRVLLSDGPTRAGPAFDAPKFDCDSDCQLCLSLRQLTTSNGLAVTHAGCDVVTLCKFSYQCNCPATVVSSIRSRGPPAAI